MYKFVLYKTCDLKILKNKRYLIKSSKKKMRAAVKAINEENVDALRTAMENIEDINIVSFIFLWSFFTNIYTVSLFLDLRRSFILRLKRIQCHLLLQF